MLALVAQPVVLHVLEAIEAGAARHVVSLVEHVTEARHEVAMPLERVGGATDRAAAARICAAGGRVHVLDMRRRPVDPRNGAAVVSLVRLVRRIRPDVVHTHSSIGGAVGRVAATVARTGAARVHTPHGLARGSLPRSVERLLGRVTDRVVVVSAGERTELAALGIVPDDRLVMIANGIEPDPPAPVSLRVEAAIPDGPLIGFVGRLAAQKEPATFLRACAIVAARHPAARFVLLGDGPLRPAMDRLAGELGLDGRLHALRHLPDAAAHLGDLAVFVSTSAWEAGPYAPLEAMRAGVPVVLTDVTGNREVVTDGYDGLLVPVGDPAAVAVAVERLLHDTALAMRLAAAGRRTVRQRFDVRATAAAHAALYRALSESGRRGGTAVA